jgi:hypothetical protein
MIKNEKQGRKQRFLSHLKMLYSSQPPDEDFKNSVLEKLKVTLNNPYGEGNSVYQRFMQLLIDSYPEVAAMDFGNRNTMTASLYNNILITFLTGVKNYDFEKDVRSLRKLPMFQEDIMKRWLRVDMNKLHAILREELPRWFEYFGGKGAKPKHNPQKKK